MPTLQRNKLSKETDDSVLKKRLSPSHPPIALTGTTHHASTVQRAKSSPTLLGASDVMRLQRMIGNQAVGKFLTNQVQRQATEMDEEAFQTQAEGELETKDEEIRMQAEEELDTEDKGIQMQAEGELEMEDEAGQTQMKEEELT